MVFMVADRKCGTFRHGHLLCRRRTTVRSEAARHNRGHGLSPALLLAASRASLGGCANLIGVCQGGWMALVYAARYPSKIRGLVLAGAPVDINAGESELRVTGAGTCAN